MQSKPYWEKRFITNKALEINRVEDRINELEKLYIKQEKAMKLDIEKFYTSYAGENGIDIAKAKVFLTSKETDLVYSEYKKLIDLSLNANDKDAEKLLQAFTKRERITRTDALIIQIQSQLTEIHNYQEKLLKETLDTAAMDGYYKSIFATFQGVGRGSTFASLSPKDIESLTTQNWQGSNWSERLWGHRAEVGANIENLIANGVYRGWSIDRMVKELTDVTGQSNYNAKRLIRTETANTYEQATLKAYGETNIEQYEYLSTLDGHTSEICRKLDGKILLTKEAKTSVNFPPMHPHCRSTTMPYTGDSQDAETRIARGADGKSYYVPADMKYSDWEKKHVDKTIIKDNISTTKETPVVFATFDVDN